MSEDFAEWLIKELDRRGWSQSEAARRGGFSSSMLSKVITGYATPGLEFCQGVAKSFGIPVEEVLRLAGILPPRRKVRRLRTAEAPRVVYEVGSPDRDLVSELVDRFERLAPATQELVLELLGALAQVPAARIIGEPAEDRTEE